MARCSSCAEKRGSTGGMGNSFLEGTLCVPFVSALEALFIASIPVEFTDRQARRGSSGRRMSSRAVSPRSTDVLIYGNMGKSRQATRLLPVAYLNASEHINAELSLGRPTSTPQKNGKDSSRLGKPRDSTAPTMAAKPENRRLRACRHILWPVRRNRDYQRRRTPTK